jgi:hypothetical protein
MKERNRDIIGGWMPCLLAAPHEYASTAPLPPAGIPAHHIITCMCMCTSTHRRTRECKEPHKVASPLPARV